MKKLTAGIFTVLMGLVSVNAADAAVASKGYVDKVVGENTTKITTLTGTVEENKEAADATAQALTEHKSAYAAKVTDLENADKALSDRITANAGAIDTLLGTGSGGDGSGTFGQLSEDVSNLKTTVGNADSGLVKKVGSLETLVGETSVATQISDALTAKVGAETVATQINTAVNSLKTTEIKANADAIKANTDAINALTGENGEITTLQGLVGETSVASQIDTAVNSLKTTEIKANADAIKANTDAIGALTGTDGAITKNTAAITTLNGDGEGSVNQKIETAIDGLDLQAISKVPAACKDANHYCVLTTNGQKFVWEIIVRDDTNLEETETGLYGEKTITQ